jgi:hypothetical protein
MASTPDPTYLEEINRHQPSNHASVKRSGNGITLYCVCGDPVIVEAGQSTLSELFLAVSRHAREKAEQAFARMQLFGGEN